MKSLLEKSKQHLNAADTLFLSEYYSSIPHCTYYACFQLMIFIQGNEEDVFEGRDSHNNLIASIKSEINKKKGHNAAFEFSNDIGKLKESRRLADYKKKIYYNKETNKNIILAKKVVSDLLAFFELE